MQPNKMEKQKRVKTTYVINDYKKRIELTRQIKAWLLGIPVKQFQKQAFDATQSVILGDATRTSAWKTMIELTQAYRTASTREFDYAWQEFENYQDEWKKHKDMRWRMWWSGYADAAYEMRNTLPKKSTKIHTPSLVNSQPQPQPQPNPNNNPQPHWIAQNKLFVTGICLAVSGIAGFCYKKWHERKEAQKQKEQKQEKQKRE